MLNTERFIQLENDGDMHDNTKWLETAKNLTLLASNYFHYLNVSNQWNIPYNHQNGMAKGKWPFYNCDGKHYAPDFSQSRDKANIKKANKEHAVCRGGGGRGGGRKSDRKKWSKSNDNKDGDINDYVNGVQKRENGWMCYFRRQ